MADNVFINIEFIINEKAVEEAKSRIDQIKEKFNEAKKTASKCANEIKTSIGGAFSKIGEYASSMGGDMADKVEGIKEKYNELGSSILEHFKEPISKLLDIASNCIDSISELLSSSEVTTILDNISSALSEVIDTVSGLISDILPSIIEGLQWMLDNSSLIEAGIVAITAGIIAFKAVAIFTEVVEAFSGLVEALKMATSAQEAFNIICDANPIGVIIALVAALVAGIIYLWTTNEGFRDAVIEVWNSICEFFSTLGEWFAGIWATLLQVFSDGWQAIVGFFTEGIPAAWQSVCDFFNAIPIWLGELWTTIKQAFVDGWQAVVDFFTETLPAWLESIVEWLGSLPESVGYALGCVIGKIVLFAVDVWNWITNDLASIIAGIIEWFASLPEKVGSIFGYVVGKIKEFAASCWSWITNDLPSIIAGIVEWFGKLPGEIWNWLLNVINKVVSWGSSVYSNATEAASNMVSAVINWFASLPGKISSCLSNVISKLIEWKNNMVSTASSAASSFASNLINTLTSLPSQMSSIGKNIVEGVWNGICGMASWFKEKVSDFFGGMVNGIKDTLGIHSPSRLMRDLIGKNLVRGIAIGFELEEPNLNKTVNGNLKSLTSMMKNTVDIETSGAASKVIDLSSYLSGGGNVVNNNDNGITQNITITQPVKSPSETARAIRRAGRELAIG